MEEAENRNQNATGIRASIVYVKDSIVNVQAGGVNDILSSLSSHRVSIGLGILAVVFGVILLRWTSIQPPNFGGQSSPVTYDEDKGSDSRKEDETVIGADENNQPKKDTSATTNAKDKRHEEVKPSWEAVARVLTAVTPLVPETVKYGQHIFVCEARSPYFKKAELRFKGKCTDQKTGFISLCEDCLSPTTSAQRAAAQLIRDMVSKGLYPSPVETQNVTAEDLKVFLTRLSDADSQLKYTCNSCDQRNVDITFVLISCCIQHGA